MNHNDFTPDISSPVIPPDVSQNDSTRPVPSENMPIAPLSSPGEGDKAYSDSDYRGGSWHSPFNYQNTNASTLENFRNTGRFTGNIPDSDPSYISSVVTVLPRPVTPCFYCNSNSFGMLRFLNTAVDYNPFMISVNNRTVVDSLNYAEVSEYGKVASGYQTITISGRNGYIYISKQLRIIAGSKTTIAVIRTAGGLDITEISDPPCYTQLNGACLRTVNLSCNTGSLSVSTHSGNVIFSNINFMDISDYTRVIPGHYELYVSSQNQVLLSTEIHARAGSQYTIYMFNWSDTPNSIRTLIIEDKN